MAFSYFKEQLSILFITSPFFAAEILFLVGLRLDTKTKILGRCIRVLCWLCAVMVALFVLLRSDALYFLLMRTVTNRYW